MSDKRAPSAKPDGIAARRAAIDAMVRIEESGAYANLLLASMFERRSLSERDRGFVTELVYGTTRMKRACDFLVDRFLLGEADPTVRAALRIGAYQMHFLNTPRHAAVGATVGAVKGRGRGLVNAVLRKVADDADKRAKAGTELEWPTLGTELSYPDWIIKRMVADLGEEPAMAALLTMNTAATTHHREDGYVQDPASQAVADAVQAKPGELILDLCAAPGGKATALASTGATVIAADLQPHRARLVQANTDKLDAGVHVLVADGANPPVRLGQADAVLIDAPCSGLGSLRRRADARWRMDVKAPERLAKLQVSLIKASLPLLKPGGRIIYSVCTLTAAETSGVRQTMIDALGPDAVGPLELRLPDNDGDGMAHFVISPSATAEALPVEALPAEVPPAEVPPAEVPSAEVLPDDIRPSPDPPIADVEQPTLF